MQAESSITTASMQEAPSRQERHHKGKGDKSRKSRKHRHKHRLEERDLHIESCQMTLSASAATESPAGKERASVAGAGGRPGSSSDTYYTNQSLSDLHRQAAVVGAAYGGPNTLSTSAFPQATTLTNFPTDGNSCLDPYHRGSAPHLHDSSGQDNLTQYVMTTLSQAADHYVPHTQEAQARLAQSKGEAATIYKELKRLVKKEKKRAKRH